MSHIISPYDRQSGFLERHLGLAIVFSIGFHAVMAWLFLIIFPGLISERKNSFEDYITVELLGSLSPPAPAAPPLEVNPDRKGPDVVELPANEAPPPQPVLTPKTPEAVEAPVDVIALGPKAPEAPPEITRAPPPPVTPPRLEPPKPPPPKPNPAPATRPRPTPERSVPAANLDDLIDSRVANVALAQGQGSGEGSESGGATRGERIDTVRSRYYAYMRDVISSNWVRPLGEEQNSDIIAVYRIRIDPDGRISGVEMETSSGAREFDLSVERAIHRSSPLAPLPEVFGAQATTVGLRFPLADLQRRARRQ